MRLVVGDHDAAMDLRDAEMPPEMNKVHWTHRSRDHDEIHRVGFGEKDRDIADCVVIEAYPQSGASWAAAFFVVVDQLLPAGSLVIVLHQLQSTGIVHPRPGEMKAVDRHSTDAGNHATQVLIARIDLRREDQHRVVQRELRLR